MCGIVPGKTILGCLAVIWNRLRPDHIYIPCNQILWGWRMAVIHTLQETWHERVLTYTCTVYFIVCHWNSWSYCVDGTVLLSYIELLKEEFKDQAHRSWKWIGTPFKTPTIPPPPCTRICSLCWSSPWLSDDFDNSIWKSFSAVGSPETGHTARGRWSSITIPSLDFTKNAWSNSVRPDWSSRFPIPSLISGVLAGAPGDCSGSGS